MNEIDKKEIKIKQYELIEQEILQTQNLRIQVFALCITAVFVIMGVKSKLPNLDAEKHSLSNTVAFILPNIALYGIIILSCLMSRILSERIKDMGAYIAVFYDDLWERLCHKIDQSKRVSSVIDGLYYAYLTLTMAVFFSTYSALGTIHSVYQNNYPTFCHITFSLIFTVCTTLAGMLVCWLRASKGTKEEYIKAWKCIKKQKLKKGKKDEEVEYNMGYSSVWELLKKRWKFISSSVILAGSSWSIFFFVCPLLEKVRHYI